MSDVVVIEPPRDSVLVQSTETVYVDVDPTGGIGLRIDDVAYTHVQAVPSATWSIAHPLAFNPNVTIVDSAGSVHEADPIYVSEGVIRIEFAGAFSGKAYLS